MSARDRAPAWLPWMAALAAIGAYALVLADVSLFHPGYAYGDERLAVGWLQDLREGAPLRWQFGHGCLTRAMQLAWVGLRGPGLRALHTPEMAVLALEWLLLALVARRWFGEEAAAWSVVAVCVCAQTWAWGRSLLAFQALPMEALAAAFGAGWVRGRASAFGWGLAASLAFLDYDGALIAVPAVWLACAALDRPFRRVAGAAALGLGTGLAALLARDHSALAGYLQVRLGTGAVSAYDPGLAGRLGFLKDLALGGPALPYFGVSRWPAWPPWAWFPLAAGVWSLRRSAGAALTVWAVGAVLVTQGVHSGYGPPLHRLTAAVPALAMLTGVGLARLRGRLGSRAWLLAALVAIGAAGEGWAWWRHQQAFAPEMYDRCVSLRLGRDALRGELAGPGVRLVTQLSGVSQADARFVFDRPPALGRRPLDGVVALVPADYAGALRGLGLKAETFWAAKGYEPLLAVRARGPAAERLESIEDSLVPLVGLEGDAQAPRYRRLRRWLKADRRRDPWTRTAALEAELEAGARSGGLRPGDIRRLADGPVVSAAPWMVLARSLYAADPVAALAYCGRALGLDPRNGEALLIAAACLRAMGDPRAGAVSRRWVALRAAGSAWRRTQ